MFSDYNELKSFVEENKISFIDLKYIDLPGRLHHVTLPADYFSEDTVKNGVGFDGSSVPFFKNLESGDLVLIPDLSSSFMDPFMSDPDADIFTLSMLCYICDAQTKEKHPYDPRSIAKKTEEYLFQKYGAESLWLSELEFYLFSEIKTEDPILEGDNPFKFITIEKQLLKQKAYEASPPEDNTHMIRNYCCKYLSDFAGIKVKYNHHEVGAKGQCEIELEFAPLLKAADNVILGKYFVRNIAHNNNMIANFMPKPIFNEAGSGLHFHQILKKKNKNIFKKTSKNPGDYDSINQKGFNYISGILKHADSVLAFTNPSTNSFKRLIPGFEAPVKKFFSKGNRSAVIRIPQYSMGTEKMSFEFRASDATANPYFAITSLLLAGLDGIENKIDNKENNFGPIDKNVFNLPKKEQDKTSSLPNSLLSSLDSLEKDNDFLKPIYPEELIIKWIKYKRDESEEIRRRIHPYEIYLYTNF